MESIVLMNSKWGNDMFVPMYLFFGGLSGGLFIISVISDLLGIKHKHYETFSKVSAYLVLPVLAIAGAFIAFHLGKPERGILFPFFFKNYDSWLVIGGWTVGLAVPLVTVYAALWYYKIDSTIRRIVGIISFPILGFVSFYTGLLLSGAKFVPLWSQKFLPLLFLNSGVLTGLAAAGLAYLIYQTFGASGSPDHLSGPAGLATGKSGNTDSSGDAGIYRAIGYFIILFVFIEFFELEKFMYYLSSNPSKLDNSGQFVVPNGSLLAYEYIIQGALSQWFWVGVIGFGLSIPLIISFVELTFDKLIKPYAEWVSCAKFTSILAGGIILRFVIVWGGELKAPLTVAPALFQIPVGG